MGGAMLSKSLIQFNSDDHYIYNCGQESLRRNGVALLVNKKSKCSTWVQSQKWKNDFSSLTGQAIEYDYNNKSNKKQIKETVYNMESELASSLKERE